MILSNTEVKKNRHGGKLFLSALLLLLLWLLVSKSRLPNEQKVLGNEHLISCGAETIKDGQFIQDGVLFGDAAGQSENHPHHGKYACRLTAENRFGLIYTTTDFQRGWKYKVSVWRYTESSKGFLEVKGNEKSNFKIRERVAIEEKNGFEKVQIIFTVPDNEQLDTLQFYAGVDRETGTVYFDDLVIEILDAQPQMADFAQDLLKIGVSDKAYNQLNRQRWQAHKVGLLFSGDDDRVKGVLYSEKENKKIPIKLRLKGDWTDHLAGNKWSFRIKAMKEGAWNRLRTFSIQHPKTRGYLKEWVFHQLLQKEDILTTRYDFIEVEFNNKNLGIYAYEEHFDKQLPESQQRREGPILKLTEDLFWLGMRRQFELGNKGVGLYKNAENAFEGSDIRAFKEGKTQASVTLSTEFRAAQKLLYQFKYGLRPASDIFDVERIAKYFVIMDVMGAYHGRFWHNLRFYYNPVSSRLEPIGFDGFGETDTPLNDEQIVLGYKVRLDDPGEDLTKILFKDPIFFKAYMGHLNRISSQAYLQDFFSDIQSDINIRLNYLHREFPEYSFKVQNFLHHAKNIHLLIEPLGEKSVLVRIQRKSDGNIHLKVTNTHAFPVEILGYGDEVKKMKPLLSKSIFVYSNVPHQVPKYTDIEIPVRAKYLFYKVAGLADIYRADITDWPIAGGVIERQLLQQDSLVSNELFEVTGQKILFRKGEHIAQKDICIPPGYEIYFEEGCQLDLQKKAAFIAQSPVFVLGTEENPVHIFSSDHTGNGFSVLQAGASSRISYCRFDHLNTLQKVDWNLTGAVTFFESPVEISHCSFTNNHCEDALNIVHTEFELTQSIIAQTFSDGFDADFCTGVVDEVIFRQTGNDGMDFSGSIITIKKAEIYDAGDKGVSVGEAAEVHIEKLQIIGANTGVASKDLSTLRIDYVHLENCIKGFAAYQKKPEYGKARIYVKGYMDKEVQFLYVLDKGSVLDLKGTKHTGEE